MKHLMDDRTGAGLQIPNFKLYQDAICLLWIKDWMDLVNKRLWNIKGFNKYFGWHNYMFYGKLQADKLFAHYYIRNNLLDTWKRYVKRLGNERPFEVIRVQIKKGEEQVFTYKDISKYHAGGYSLCT